MNVAIYARVSKADEDDPNSVPVQLADCRERAAAEGWTVVDEYVDEGISAWDPRKERPAYRRLVADVRTGRATVVLAREQERLIRQSAKDAITIAELAETGALKRLAFVLESDIHFTRARDRKEFRDRASSAEFYSDFLSEKVRRTMQSRAASGEWNGGGRRPFGYRVVVDPDRAPRKDGRPFRKLVPDPTEAARLRDAAKSVLAGGSLHSLVASWNDGPDPVRKDSGSRWTLTDVRRVLLSPQVAGIRRHRREGIEVAGTWEPILTREEHDLLTLRLTDPTRRTIETKARQVGRRHVLAGIVRCGRCGCRLDGKVQHRANGDRRQYVCTSANGG
jgi:DNA invertase Pin-like site-specific DNA recombinase